jgi:hypothetical protein
MREGRKSLLDKLFVGQPENSLRRTRLPGLAPTGQGAKERKGDLRAAPVSR